MTVNIAYLYYLLSYGSLSSVMMLSSLKKTKTSKKKKKVKRKKHKLEEQVHKLVEQEQPPLEAEPKTTLPEEEIKQITEPEKKPSEKEAPSELKYTADIKESEEGQQGYINQEVKKVEKPAYVEQIKTENTAEPGYIDPAALKAGVPRKGYIESKGLLKDPMLEELKKKHEEDTKKEYAQRHQKMYGRKEKTNS